MFYLSNLIPILREFIQRFYLLQNLVSNYSCRSAGIRRLVDCSGRPLIQPLQRSCDLDSGSLILGRLGQLVHRWGLLCQSHSSITLDWSSHVASSQTKHLACCSAAEHSSSLIGLGPGDLDFDPRPSCSFQRFSEPGICSPNSATRCRFKS